MSDAPRAAPTEQQIARSRAGIRNAAGAWKAAGVDAAVGVSGAVYVRYLRKATNSSIVMPACLTMDSNVPRGTSFLPSTIDTV